MNEEATRFHGHDMAEPIGMEYLVAALGAAGYVARIVTRHSCRVLGPENGPDLMLLSGVTCEWPAVLECALKAKREGSLTVVGGYHASGVARSALGGLFDYAVVGEGERAVVELADRLFGKAQGSRRIRSDAQSSKPVVIEAPRISQLDELHRPERAERFLSSYKLLDLMWPPASRQRYMALVLGSRGCANDCDFCASSTVWGTGIRLRSQSGVVDELRDLKARFATNAITFIDQSFGQIPKWSLDLCGEIRDADLGINWYHQSNLTIRREVVRAMAEAGCRKIGFGLEGISPRAVEWIKPVNPYDFGTVNSLIDYCNSLGLFVKVYLMMGYPWETEEVIAEYFGWIPRIRANQVKISFMTPFPGTRDWGRYSDQLVTRSWAHFDTVSMPVVRNPRIRVEQYLGTRQQLFHTFYGSPTYAEVTRLMLDRFPHYELSYREFAAYLQAHGMITGNEEWLEYVGYNADEPEVPVPTEDLSPLCS